MTDHPLQRQTSSQDWEGNENSPHVLAGKHHQLERCITFMRIQDGDPRFHTDPARPVTMLMTFTPKVALTASVQLLVSRAGGGQWKVDVHLEALQPDIDGLVRSLSVAPSAILQCDGD